MIQIEKPTGTAPDQPTLRRFPTPDTNLGRLLSDPEFRRTFHARLRTWNPAIVAFYRAGLLPLFGASRTVMLLTTKGRKSGKLRRFPVGYFRIGGDLYVFSAWGKQASWYKNLCANPDAVTLQIGLQRLSVRPHVLENPVEIQHTLEQFVRESPTAARYLFGWQPESDSLACADFSPIIKNVLIIRFVKTL
jgi:deazaflavin-dependent oxidoreductase (nitroreductase family)